MSALKLFLPLDSVAIAMGADDVADALQNEAAKRKIKLELVRTGSRGMHWLEPLLEVEKDCKRIGYGPVSEDDAVSVLDAILGDGRHDKCVGLVEEIPFFKKQTRLIFERCGVTDPLSLEDYKSHGGFEGLDKALNIDGAAICEEIMQSGLRGRGGAGFPAGIKWKTVSEAKADQKYIVVNADEGDSGTFADRMIMEGDPFCLIEGMIIAGVAVGATKGFVYLRSEYPIAERVLNGAIVNARAAGVLGDNIRGTGKTFDIEVFVGAGAYICGEETSLLNSLEGKRGEVRAKPPLPALEGLFGKPTLVHNVISLCSVPAILAKGAKFYRDYGMGKSTGTMPFQLAGNIKYGGLFETAFGVTLGELVNDIGGGTFTEKSVRAAQIGGPLGAYLPPEMYNLPMDYETMLANGAGVGHGGVVVFDESVNLLEQARYAFEFCVEESCGKCTPCRIGSVRGVEVIDRIRAGRDHEKNVTVLDDLCELMVDGSLCAMGGMTPIPVQSAVKHFPEDFGIKQKQEAAT
ncbi:NADH-ubiquinone oxidoreductase-F iron-sulfur binding region domain-containing protein [Hyphococcus flavus]|uniref:NADH-ubiquinone oxidoreductase-F iron-sulfur binding region domain-containing protein n=1 Tax=Hyphococcus flavus TaxID=1866326 RepID=A0AAF0CFS0_9PROT|nr:formate dehydrogenase beta subunit [Hyphococcus flavus]WDI31348.1 NADH-ubiquinone oxidoreductase-F iron-sulfur binding region domain-containing protein [Hyphococcus flavus]